jgi:hypothetical protein
MPNARQVELLEFRRNTVENTVSSAYVGAKPSYMQKVKCEYVGMNIKKTITFSYKIDDSNEETCDKSIAACTFGPGK